MKNYEAIFAANLKRFRKERGITQKDLATATGYSEKTVSKWECAASIPDIGGLFAVGEALQVSVEELFHDGEEVYFLGIDGGGTKTALVLADAGGNIMRTLRTKNCNPFDIGIDACKEVLGNAIREICGNKTALRIRIVQTLLYSCNSLLWEISKFSPYSISPFIVKSNMQPLFFFSLFTIFGRRYTTSTKTPQSRRVRWKSAQQGTRPVRRKMQAGSA